MSWVTVKESQAAVCQWRLTAPVRINAYQAVQMRQHALSWYSIWSSTNLVNKYRCWSWRRLPSIHRILSWNRGAPRSGFPELSGRCICMCICVCVCVHLWCTYVQIYECVSSRSIQVHTRSGCSYMPASVKKNIPLVRALALQSSSRNCNPAPDLVFWKLISPPVLSSRGVCFSQTPVSDVAM